jgi:DNA-binding XRE family transcriptional regulator
MADQSSPGDLSIGNRVADLERRLEEAEDEHDALELCLAKIEDAVLGGVRTPSVVVDRLAKGAQQVRVWREYRGLSLRALAEKAGISAAMLSEIEHAKMEGSVRTLSALAGALGLDLDDLVPWN